MSKPDVSKVCVLSFSISLAEDPGGINEVFCGISEPYIPEMYALFSIKKLDIQDESVGCSVVCLRQMPCLSQMPQKCLICSVVCLNQDV